MNFVRRNTAALPVMLIAASLLGGCGFFSRHAERQNDSYKQSVQSRPLEVPPDLDNPASSTALTIPDARPAPSAPEPATTGASTPGGEPPAIASPSAAAPPAV